MSVSNGHANHTELTERMGHTTVIKNEFILQQVSETSYSQTDSPSRPNSVMKVHMRSNTFNLRVKNLKRAPSSLLAQLAQEHSDNDTALEFCFDRDPYVFAAIETFYSQGHLHIPSNICISALEQELNFWKIDFDFMEPCCWEHFQRVKEESRFLIQIEEEWSRLWLTPAQLYNMDVIPLKYKIWAIITRPGSSRWAMAYCIISMGFIFLSVLVLCLDTLPELRGNAYDDRVNASVMCYQKNSTNTRSLKFCQMNMILLCFEIITSCVLTIEMVFRQCLAPPGNGFRSSKYNFVMILAILPAWLVIIMEISHRHLNLTFSSSVDTLFIILYDMRVIRVFLVAKLGEYHQGLFVLLLSLRASIRELSLVLILLFIFVIVYGNLIFFLEMRHDKIKTVAHGFWWALITMTTVGYGDTYPVSVGGYLVGCACAITGILVVALPIPVISQNFSACYRCIRAVNRKIDRQRNKKIDTSKKDH